MAAFSCFAFFRRNGMSLLSPLILAFGLGACSSGDRSVQSVASAPPVARATSPAPAATVPAEAAAKPEAGTTPFAGSWQDCAGAESPDECSRYLLLQQADRICGTWSYVATGKLYDGRVMAKASSPTQARRTQACGQTGSETNTKCSQGWQAVDKPLQLCGGKLGDTAGKPSECHASYERTPDADQALATLAAEPWMEACLAGREPGAQP